MVFIISQLYTWLVDIQANIRGVTGSASLPHAMSQREKLLGLLINEQLLVPEHFYPDVLVLPHYKWKNVTGGKLVNQVIMENSFFPTKVS